LYLISDCKERVIEEVGHWEENVWVWDLTWRRLRLVWEVAMEEQLILLLNRHSLKIGISDTWKWKDNDNGVFSVKSAYNKLQGSSNEEENKEFKTLWSIRVAPKAQLLGWRLFLDKLPTKVKLAARGIQLQNNLCEMCLASEENAEHLFFSCRASQKVWNMCDRWIGVSSVHHVNARDNFQHFHLVNLNRRQNKIWQGMWLAIIGEIWKHRNGVIFKHRKVDPEEIFALAQVTAWVWMKHKSPSVMFSYSDWILSPYVCLKSL